MRHLKTRHGALLGCAAGFAMLIGAYTGANAIAQPEGEMDMEAMMQTMRESSKPGPHHKLLKPMVGKWNCEMSFVMPDGSSVEAKGKSVNDWVLGGRYLKQTFTADNFVGAPFEGFGFIGYDKHKGHYVSNWLDDMSTGIMMVTGHASEDGKILTMEGEIPEGPQRHVTKIISDDKHVLEFHLKNPINEEWMKTGEIVYTRQATAAADN